ncbi:MAG: phosphotransferase [Candidatus Obscuribacterales bacterium]|nr:phosphotransferase [Steroidobacteraceae bacterium]
MREHTDTALYQTWRTLSESLLAPDRDALEDAAGGHSIVARSHGSWLALPGERQRLLLVPSRNRAAQRTGLRFFLVSASHLTHAKLALTASQWIARARLPQLSLPEASAPTLIDRLSVTESPQVAFSIGPAGQSQKASMLLMSQLGDPQVLVKISMHAGADQLIAHEAKWLRKLSASLLLAPHVPTLLRYGSTRDGRHYLVTTVMPGRTNGATFTDAHRHFLRMLSTIQYEYRDWSVSTMGHYLTSGLEKLAASMTSQLHALLATAVAECAQCLLSWHGPYVTAHGDFSPGNIRGDTRSIAVFNWEHAIGGAVPIFDVLHFMVAPRVSAGRPVGIKEWKTALAQAQAYAQPVFADYEWDASTVAAQGLAYLLYRILFYSLAHGGVIENDSMTEGYLKLVEERAQWRQWAH